MNAAGTAPRKTAACRASFMVTFRRRQPTGKTVVDRALTPNEVRVLGSLVEKEITTPDNYPLTMNALTNACNQSSNRDPVMQLTEEDVHAAVEGLRHQNLARVIKTSGSRVNKVQQLMSSRMDLSPAEVAVLTTLMLRGGQTLGELRSRSDRLHPF